MPIDAIFTIYEIGFTIFNKGTCGPWIVPINGENFSTS